MHAVGLVLVVVPVLGEQLQQSHRPMLVQQTSSLKALLCTQTWSVKYSSCDAVLLQQQGLIVHMFEIIHCYHQTPNTNFNNTRSQASSWLAFPLLLLRRLLWCLGV